MLLYYPKSCSVPACLIFALCLLNIRSSPQCSRRQDHHAYYTGSTEFAKLSLDPLYIRQQLISLFGECQDAADISSIATRAADRLRTSMLSPSHHQSHCSLAFTTTEKKKEEEEEEDQIKMINNKNIFNRDISSRDKEPFSGDEQREGGSGRPTSDVAAAMAGAAEAKAAMVAAAVEAKPSAPVQPARSGVLERRRSRLLLRMESMSQRVESRLDTESRMGGTSSRMLESRVGMHSRMGSRAAFR
jgi:hypothetical protein